MPIYEFKCENCHKMFDELIRSTKALEEIHCPYCEHNKVGRVMSSFGFSSGSTSSYSTTGSSCGSCSSKNCTSCR